MPIRNNKGVTRHDNHQACPRMCSTTSACARALSQAVTVRAIFIHHMGIYEH
jgi:hypothetical protein